MGVYKNTVITNAGNELIAKAVAGETEIKFSKACTSSYIYPDGTDISALEELQDVMQTVIPSDVQVLDNLISVRAIFGNENILTEYLIQNVGFYATDGEREILLVVCEAEEPDQMPVYNGVAPSSFIYNIQITVDGAKSINLTINPAGTATVQDILDLRKTIKDIHTPWELSLPASAWSGEAPYTQTIQLEGVTAEDSLEIGILLTDDGDAASRKAKRKAWGFVDRAVTGEGTVTFYCYDKKPAADIVVLAKGVIG